MNETRKKGRPVMDVSERRDHKFDVRLREDEYERLIYLAHFYDVSIADVLRIGIENNFELHRRGQDIRYFG